MSRWAAALQFVIPTGADPDFLHAALTDGHVCGFNRMKFANATNLNRKSGGAQGRDLLFA
jgi:hypothetical protein